MKRNIVSKLSTLVLAALLVASMGVTAFADTANVGFIDGNLWKGAEAPSATNNANRMLTAKLGVGTTEDPSITMDIMEDYKTALAEATANNTSTIKLRLSNVSYIPLETNQNLAKLAASANKTISVYADRRDGHLTVLSLLVYDPADATKDLYPFLYNDPLHTNPAVRLFDRYYHNNLVAIHCRQEVDFGMPVSLSIKLDLAKMDATNLYFYTYDKVANEYRALGDVKHVVDANGYMQLTTEKAGDIIVTSGSITKY